MTGTRLATHTAAKKKKGKADIYVKFSISEVKVAVWIQINKIYWSQQAKGRCLLSVQKRKGVVRCREAEDRRQHYE